MVSFRTLWGTQVAVLAISTCKATPEYGSVSFTQIGDVIEFLDADDTPAFSYIDKNGDYYYQSSHSLYGVNDTRQWSFFTGINMDNAIKNDSLSNYVNPTNGEDSNGNTTWRCNNSPTGKASTVDPDRSSYVQPNYCDLVGVWVDPDTGDWIGLVHNEFTPQPFGDGIHYDAIDYTVSTDEGRTWSIPGHAITSPYPTNREDNQTFPHQTYYYGDGDPRLTVDIASGYFYVQYGSRIVDKGASWVTFYQHVARAPMSGKMASGTWNKWYNGTWTEPGVGGKESNTVPVTEIPTGYTSPVEEYSPLTNGTAEQQGKTGSAPPTTPLFVMDIVWNAYLGLWIGEPSAVNQTGVHPQQYYGTNDLTTQKWTLVGDSGSYQLAAWYKWFLDPVCKTNSGIVGQTFRVYCAVDCSKYDAEYTTFSVNTTDPPSSTVKLGAQYHILAGSRMLSVTNNGSATSVSSEVESSENAIWSFTSVGDGSYVITNSASQILGVSSTNTDSRAWGSVPGTSMESLSLKVGQQWWIIQGRSGSTNELTGDVRLVNRYSQLVLAMSSEPSRLVETVPPRSWDDSTGSNVGAGRRASEQSLTLVQVGG